MILRVAKESRMANQNSFMSLEALVKALEKSLAESIKEYQREQDDAEEDFFKNEEIGDDGMSAAGLLDHLKGDPVFAKSEGDGRDQLYIEEVLVRGYKLRTDATKGAGLTLDKDFAKRI